MYTDKSLNCADCGASFIFTAGEQEFHASKGFTNEPRRCPNCRTARRGSRDGGGGGGQRGGFGGGAGGGQRREMFDVQCAQCGKMTQVPFNPRGDRPVYCSDCFRSSNSYSGSSGPRSGGGGGGGRGGSRW